MLIREGENTNKVGSAQQLSRNVCAKQRAPKAGADLCPEVRAFFCQTGSVSANGSDMLEGARNSAVFWWRLMKGPNWNDYSLGDAVATTLLIQLCLCLGF
jgi:hypothetical protein